MFKNREEAGRLLAKELLEYKGQNIMVLAIPRGGVVVGRVVADLLQVPLDIIVVRKIGSPNNPELAIGAVSPGQTVYWDWDLIKKLAISRKLRSILKKSKLQEQKDREKLLRGDKDYDNIKDKIIILIDDGVATGATVLAAKKFLRKKVKAVILAVPVASRDVLTNIERYFDRIIALSVEEKFYAVGQFYQEFSQVEDNEVLEILNNKRL